MKNKNSILPELYLPKVLIFLIFFGVGFFMKLLLFYAKTAVAELKLPATSGILPGQELFVEAGKRKYQI